MTTRIRLTRAQKVRIFDRHKGICHICQTKIQVGQKWEVEHVVPIWAGGADAPENMAPAHKAPCHRSKTDNETPVRAKGDRVRATHLGIPKPGKKMRGGRRSDETITFNHGVQPRRSLSQKHADLMEKLYPWGIPE